MNAYTRTGISLALALLTGVVVSGLTAPARAGDNITIKVPTPPLPPIPKITLRVPPPMVWLPAPKVYVARDTSHNIFYHENRYYLYQDDHWYAAPGYEGPWIVVRVDHLPPGLRAYRRHDWDHYQREAERRHRYHDGDGHRHAFYAHPREHRGYERVRWSDWNRDHRNHGDRGWHGHNERGHERGRGDNRDHADRGRGDSRDHARRDDRERGGGRDRDRERDRGHRND